MENRNQNSARLFQNPTALHSLLEPAMQPVRAYQKKVKRKQFQPEFARFKLKFYYKDGNQSVHYSYDFYYTTENGERKKIHDESDGWLKLLRLIEKNKDLFICAMIWCKLGDDTNVRAGGYNNECAKFKANGSVSINTSIGWRHGRMDWQLFNKLHVSKSVL